MTPAGRIGLALSLAALALALVGIRAQDTGQICLLAFVDQDEDGRRGATEPPIARGIAASLLDERGVTIRSALLEDSPYAPEGLLCFDELLAGQYSIIVSSSQYNPTTPTAAEAVVRPGAAPARIDFAAKPLTVQSLPNALPGLAALDAATAQTLLVAGAAAALIILLSLLGALLTALIIRRRRRARLAAARSIGQASSARGNDEPPAASLTKQPGQGSPTVFSDQDEGW